MKKVYGRWNSDGMVLILCYLTFLVCQFLLRICVQESSFTFLNNML